MQISQIPIVMIGNLFYHFDRALFGLLVPFLAPIFFPQVDPIYALIYMYAISPLSLLAKPLGAIVFGHLGDRWGTQKILSITLFGMAIKTGIMGFLPTYDQVGFFAPLLLAFTRLMISFFSSGETTGGAISLFENSPPEKRNLMSALYDASGILGILFASLSVWILHSYQDFWRILFWSGSAIGTVGWYFRRISMKQTPKKSVSLPPFPVLWHHRALVLKIALLAGFSYANYYLITSFLNGFLPLVSPLTNGEAISLNTTLLFLDFLLLPLFGILSLKIRRENLILISIVGITIFCGPLFLLLKEATLLKAGFVRIFLMVFGVVLAAPYHAWVFEKTPPDHRYLLGAFSSAVGGRIFGSPILPIGLWLYKKTGSVVAPTIPLIVLGVCSLSFFVREEFVKAAAPQDL